MPATAADIPNIYDLVIEGKGYMFAREVDPNVPFRTQRAKYGYTQTFVERSNVNGDFGDNQQDFWLTAAMRDWSKGEGLKFFKIADQSKQQQFNTGTNLDVTTAGQVSVAYTSTSTSAGANVRGCFMNYTSTTTNLLLQAASLGAHGCGGFLTAYAFDGTYLFIGGSATTKTRKYNVNTTVFSDYCATVMEDLLFLNNTVYGVAAGNFYTIDTAGAATSQFIWKDGAGGTVNGTMKLAAFGGKVLILRTGGSAAGAELWQYDGAMVKLAEFPSDLNVKDFCVSDGIVFVIGLESRGAFQSYVSLYYYLNGNIDRTWRSLTASSTGTNDLSIVSYGNGVLFTNFIDAQVYQYDLTQGSVCPLFPYGRASSNVNISQTNGTAMITVGQPSVVTWGTSVNGYPSTATLVAPIVDFDSSLQKTFRSVRVDFDANSGSVDVHFDVDNGASTGDVIGISSGVETVIGSIPGHQIQLTFTIHTNTTLTPVIKRIYVRGVPVQPAFRTGEFILDCTGANGKQPVILRNGTPHPLTGQQMVNNLLAAFTQTAGMQISDRLGTYLAVAEIGAAEFIEVAPNEYYARFSVRQI